MSDMKKDWGGELKDAFNRAGGAKRPIRLPKSGKIDFGGTAERVTVHMKAEAVAANMQTDESAFEAWSLALVAWCGVKSVVLTWEPPEEPGKNLHYQRFLYRAHHFSKLFTWFELGCSTDGARALASRTVVLNVPGDRDSEDTDYKNHGGEAALERRLCYHSKTFKVYFGLDSEGAIHRQVPVGVFEGKVSNGTRIFPGGKSAIDLVGTSDETLVVFEIKDGDNLPAGILSELLFYACVMRDAIPGPKGGAPRFEIRTKGDDDLDVRGFKRIKAVLLAPALHPLIGHARMLKLLNAALASQAQARDQVPVEFAAATFIPPTGDDKDYEFKPLKDEEPRA